MAGSSNVLMQCFARARRGAVSVIFAATAVPMIGIVGLAVDYGIWNQTNATLSVAANVAALTAVKMTANAQLAGDTNAVTEGKQGGEQWFLAEVGANTKIGTTGVSLSNKGATVTVTGGTTVTATVAYSGQVPSIFGGIFFQIASYPINGQAVAQVTSAPFLNVEILLDNSSSMEIGATDNDIAQLQSITPCYVAQAGQQSPGAYYTKTAPAASNSGNLAGQAYQAYATSGYTGSVTVPQVAPKPPLSYSNYQVKNGGSTLTQTCKGYTASYQGTGKSKIIPYAGPPCAFACHFDNSKPAGQSNDFFALARSTKGSSNPITLRFDLVKAATNNVISTMESDNIASLNNLQVGLFTFADTLNKVYPPSSCGTGPSCEAGNDWATAISDVGSPPNSPNQPDTGIQPDYTPTSANTGDTDFHDAMVSLSQQLTPSGDGTTTEKARKVLFIVTDGLSDTGSPRAYTGVSAADCTLFKNMGYTIYVVFTPYYPVMNGFYISNIKPVAEPTTGSTIYNDMQACATSSSDFISASSGQELIDALNGFLRAALNTPARFTM